MTPKVLVGHDASGLELRMLAHYMNDEEYTQLILEGDIHTHNQKTAGLPTRDSAKIFIYASILYGAGDLKTGQIIGKGAREGKAIKAKFFAKQPKLKILIDKVTKAASRGYLVGLDGRRLIMRRNPQNGQVQTHKALNTLLQGAGSVVMKYSIVLLDQWIREESLDVIKVLDYHDEGAAEVIPEDVDRYMELAVLSVVKAGEMLNLNCRLDADARAGKTWADIH